MNDKPSPEQDAHAEELQRQIDDLVAGHSGPPSTLREFAEQFEAPSTPSPDAPKTTKKPKKH